MQLKTNQILHATILSTTKDIEQQGSLATNTKQWSDLVPAIYQILWAQSRVLLYYDGNKAPLKLSSLEEQQYSIFNHSAENPLTNEIIHFTFYKVNYALHEPTVRSD